MNFNTWSLSGEYCRNLQEVVETGNDDKTYGWAYDDGSYIKLADDNKLHVLIGNEEKTFTELLVAERYLWTNWSSSNYS